MGRARDAKRFLQTFRDTGIIAQQNASEKRSLRLGENLRNHILGARLERTPRKRGEPRERREALTARDANARHARA